MYVVEVLVCQDVKTATYFVNQNVSTTRENERTVTKKDTNTCYTVWYAKKNKIKWNVVHVLNFGNVAVGQGELFTPSLLRYGCYERKGEMSGIIISRPGIYIYKWEFPALV